MSNHVIENDTRKLRLYLSSLLQFQAKNVVSIYSYDYVKLAKWKIKDLYIITSVSYGLNKTFVIYSTYWPFEENLQKFSSFEYLQQYTSIPWLVVREIVEGGNPKSIVFKHNSLGE